MYSQITRAILASLYSAVIHHEVVFLSCAMMMNISMSPVQTLILLKVNDILQNINTGKRKYTKLFEQISAILPVPHTRDYPNRPSLQTKYSPRLGRMTPSKDAIHHDRVECTEVCCS